MKTKPIQKNKINVVTLGCSKNIFDSEVLMKQLEANRFKVDHESEEYDSEVVIINTCGFIDNAKQESIDTILHYADAKEEGKLDKLIVTGCLSERYSDDLRREIPQVDSWFGTQDLPRLLKTLKADYRKELVGERLLTTPNHYAYLKISEGCDRPCSFCAIPLMRGSHRSTPKEELVKQARNLVRNGVKEIMLIAQDLTYYGLDIYKKRALSDLLKDLSDIEGLSWIRLHYAYPSGFPMDVIDVMKERPNICNYLDIPLQHASSNILKSMRRGINKEKTYDLIKRIRDIIPEICLRTTLIAGYPGETENDFLEMLDWVNDVKFDRLGVFTYSHEEDTHAHNLADDVPQEVKVSRMERIMQAQSEISFEKNQQYVGKEFQVLIDRMEGDHFIGRTEYDSPEVDNEVIVSASNGYARIGDFVLVKINEASTYDLHGVLINC